MAVALLIPLTVIFIWALKQKKLGRQQSDLSQEITMCAVQVNTKAAFIFLLASHLCVFLLCRRVLTILSLALSVIRPLWKNSV